MPPQQYVESFDVLSLQPGQTILITTVEGNFYVTATDQLRPLADDLLADEHVVGVSVQATASALHDKREAPNPYETRMLRFLTINGHHFISVARYAVRISAIWRMGE